MRMQIIEGKLIPESEVPEHDPTKILQEVEIGLWTLVKPYVWKITVGIAFFILGALSYFSLRNSQNSYKIESLNSDLQNLKDQFWKKNEESRQWWEQKDNRLTEYKTRIENLEKLEDRLYKSSGVPLRTECTKCHWKK